MLAFLDTPGAYPGIDAEERGQAQLIATSILEMSRLPTPVVCVVPSPAGRGVLHDKIVSNIQEVRARGARTVVIAEEGDDAVLPYADDLIRVPRTPTLLAPLGGAGSERTRDLVASLRILLGEPS